jgi:hypothetical protein
MQINVSLTEESNVYYESYEIKTEIHADMEDASIETYFVLFTKIMAHAGFDRYEMLQGAADFVFSDSTDPATLKKIAEHHDLILSESLLKNN